MQSLDDDLRNIIQTPRRRGPAGVVSAVVHLAAMGLCMWASLEGWWPLVVLLWGVIIWLNHAALTLLHEAGHGLLGPARWVNELQGMVIGTAALIPLSVYRYVHARHHAHLGRERDPEFWPYNLPAMPRVIRLGYAWIELLAGWPVTPLLYSIRTAESWSLVPRRQRYRVVLEWFIMIVSWAVLLWVVNINNWWIVFVAGFVIPSWGAGVLQTIRKFTEHLGMHGDSIMSMTRTVIYQQPIGQVASRSQLHVDHHGTHHRYARIPFYRLPDASDIVYGGENTKYVYRSHWAAIGDMLPHLLNPKTGPQWNEGVKTT